MSSISRIITGSSRVNAFLTSPLHIISNSNGLKANINPFSSLHSKPPDRVLQPLFPCDSVTRCLSPSFLSSLHLFRRFKSGRSDHTDFPIRPSDFSRDSKPGDHSQPEKSRHAPFPYPEHLENIDQSEIESKFKPELFFHEQLEQENDSNMSADDLPVDLEIRGDLREYQEENSQVLAGEEAAAKEAPHRSVGGGESGSDEDDDNGTVDVEDVMECLKEVEKESGGNACEWPQELTDTASKILSVAKKGKIAEEAERILEDLFEKNAIDSGPEDDDSPEADARDHKMLYEYFSRIEQQNPTSESEVDEEDTAADFQLESEVGSSDQDDAEGRQQQAQLLDADLYADKLGRDVSKGKNPAQFSKEDIIQFFSPDGTQSTTLDPKQNQLLSNILEFHESLVSKQGLFEDKVQAFSSSTKNFAGSLQMDTFPDMDPTQASNPASTVNQKAPTHQAKPKQTPAASQTLKSKTTDNDGMVAQKSRARQEVPKPSASASSPQGFKEKEEEEEDLFTDLNQMLQKPDGSASLDQELEMMFQKDVKKQAEVERKGGVLNVEEEDDDDDEKIDPEQEKLFESLFQQTFKDNPDGSFDFNHTNDPLKLKFDAESLFKSLADKDEFKEEEEIKKKLEGADGLEEKEEALFEAMDFENLTSKRKEKETTKFTASENFNDPNGSPFPNLEEDDEFSNFVKQAAHPDLLKTRDSEDLNQLFPEIAAFYNRSFPEEMPISLSVNEGLQDLSQSLISKFADPQAMQNFDFESDMIESQKRISETSRQLMEEYRERNSMEEDGGFSDFDMGFDDNDFVNTETSVHNSKKPIQDDLDQYDHLTETMNSTIRREKRKTVRIFSTPEGEIEEELEPFRSKSEALHENSLFYEDIEDVKKFLNSDRPKDFDATLTNMEIQRIEKMINLAGKTEKTQKANKHHHHHHPPNAPTSMNDGKDLTQMSTDQFYEDPIFKKELMDEYRQVKSATTYDLDEDVDDEVRLSPEIPFANLDIDALAIPPQFLEAFDEEKLIKQIVEGDDQLILNPRQGQSFSDQDEPGSAHDTDEDLFTQVFGKFDFDVEEQTPLPKDSSALPVEQEKIAIIGPGTSKDQVLQMLDQQSSSALPTSPLHNILQKAQLLAELQSVSYRRENSEQPETDSQLRVKEEATRLRAQEEEATRLRAQEEEATRLRAQEEEATRLRAQEEEATRLRAQEEEATRLRAQEEEATRLRAQEEEATRLRAQEEEATRLRAQEEEAARLRAQEEEEATRLRAQEEEKARQRAENQAQLKALAEKQNLIKRVIEEEIRAHQLQEQISLLERDLLESYLPKASMMAHASIEFESSQLSSAESFSIMNSARKKEDTEALSHANIRKNKLSATPLPSGKHFSEAVAKNFEEAMNIQDESSPSFINQRKLQREKVAKARAFEKEKLLRKKLSTKVSQDFSTTDLQAAIDTVFPREEGNVLKIRDYNNDILISEGAASHLNDYAYFLTGGRRYEKELRAEQRQKNRIKRLRQKMKSLKLKKKFVLPKLD